MRDYPAMHCAYAVHGSVLRWESFSYNPTSVAPPSQTTPFTHPTLIQHPLQRLARRTQADATPSRDHQCSHRARVVAVRPSARNAFLLEPHKRRTTVATSATYTARAMFARPSRCCHTFSYNHCWRSSAARVPQHVQCRRRTCDTPNDARVYTITPIAPYRRATTVACAADTQILCTPWC